MRAQFRYQSTDAACSAGAYNDRDDLVFAVTSTPVTTVFFDNFETAPGWTTNPNGTDTATTGLWERGDPEPTTDDGAKQLGTTISGVNDLVTGRLAGASAGAYDIDNGVTTIQSPRHHAAVDGHPDAVVPVLPGPRVELLERRLLPGPGGRVDHDARSSTSLGAAVNRNGAWTAFSANISAFAGQTVRIRIEAADASTARLVEAGVDDVRITQQ